MKFQIDNLHREYFDDQGLVEFEQLFTDAELAPVLAELGARQKVFFQGHDLWRKSAPVKKMVFSPRLAQIASELTDEKPLRLAFDQLFAGTPAEVFSRPVSLLEISSFQGLACGLIVRLSGQSEATTLVPKNAGSGVYFLPDRPWDFTELFREEGLFLLIAYTEARSVFIVCPTDPFVSDARRLGYAVGDRLDEKRNPTVYR